LSDSKTLASQMVPAAVSTALRNSKLTVTEVPDQGERRRSF